jgi:hypothetical protein
LGLTSKQLMTEGKECSLRQSIAGRSTLSGLI